MTTPAPAPTPLNHPPVRQYQANHLAQAQQDIANRTPQSADARALSPLQQLEANRARINQYLDAQRVARQNRQAQSPLAMISRATAQLMPNNDSGQAAQAWLDSGVRAVKRWWHHHPAHPYAQVATAMGEQQVRRHPFAAVAGAALLGAVVVIARPWRSKRLMRLAFGSTVVAQAKHFATQTLLQQASRMLSNAGRPRSAG